MSNHLAASTARFERLSRSRCEGQRRIGTRLGQLIVLTCLMVFACHDTKSGPAEKKSEPQSVAPKIQPLEIREVPQSVDAEVFPVAGARGPRPVAVMISERASDCQAARAAYSGRAHVLCSRWGSRAPRAESQDAAHALHHGIEFLKRTYPTYVAGSPVHLLTSSRYSRTGFRMLLREPQVFSFAYLSGLNPEAITATTLSALQGNGARILLIDAPFSTRLKILARAAGRHGLGMLGVGGGDLGLSRALRTFNKADPRLAPTVP